MSGGAPVHVLFDLDDTLYPAATGFFRLVSARIHDYVQRELGLPPQPARVLQRRYWKRYGTSLRGLMLRHGIDPVPFLEFVHDVPVETHLTPRAELRTMLRRIGARRHVFTNGPEAYARRVLRSLAIEDCFERVLDIACCDYVPKPNEIPYDRVESILGARGGEIALVEDSPRNLGPARARGWRTVWLRTHGSGAFTEAAPPPEIAERIIERVEDAAEALGELGVPLAAAD